MFCFKSRGNKGTQKDKDYLIYTFLTPLTVLLLLLLLSMIGEYRIGDWVVKRADILSTLRHRNEQININALTYRRDTRAYKDSLDSALQQIRDSVAEGIQPIEDFSDNQQELYRFYGLLDSVKQLNRPIRIAFMGDSFLEGDILVADFREMMHARYGGRGVGYVPMFNPSAGFRKTIGHTYSGWRDYSMVSNKRQMLSTHSLMGQFCVSDSSAYSLYKGSTYKAHIDSFSVARLLYSSQRPVTLYYRINGESLSHQVSLPASESIHEYTITSDNIGSLHLTIAQREVVCYGVSLEDRKGIVVDNLALRSHSGIPISSIATQKIQELNSLQHYDLIILEYGLNATSHNITKYPAYEQQMTQVVSHLKQAMPHTALLLWSVGDRTTKSHGANITSPGVIGMIKAQRSIAQQSQIAFWNLFLAMGGEGSMSSMVESVPAMANKDYTHINFAGGRHMAQLFFQTLMFEKQKYDTLQAYKRNHSIEN